MSQRNPLILANLIRNWCEQQPDLNILTFVTIDADGALQDETRSYQQLWDNGQRLAAVIGLAKDPQVGTTLAALTTAWESSRGDISAELHFNILEAVGKVGTPEARVCSSAGSATPSPTCAILLRALSASPSSLAPRATRASSLAAPR